NRLADLRAVIERFSATRPSRIGIHSEPYSTSDLESTRPSAEVRVATSTSRSSARILHKGTASAIGTLGVVLAVSLLFAFNRAPAETNAIDSESPAPVAMAAQLAPAAAPDQQDFPLPIEHSETDANSSQDGSDLESTLPAKTNLHHPSMRTEPSKPSASKVLSPFRNLGGRL
ncbi:MAG TPA: hypothetical protein VKP30_23590, partial [Polyangiaceae bacterium]|nr:hypothetical protein [Polyangiaceae bacterium]